MKYLRAFYSHSQFYKMNFDRLEFAPVTVFCGCSENRRSVLINAISQNIFNKYLNYDSYWELREDMGDLPEEADDWYSYNSYSDDLDSEDCYQCSEEYQQFEKLENHWNMFDSEIYDKYEDMYDYFHTGKIHAVFETDDDGMDILPEKVLVKRFNDYLDDVYDLDTLLSDRIKSEFSDFSDYDMCILDSIDTVLSIDEQIKLAEYIEQCAYQYRIQFIIATTSPVIAKIKDALIYDIDLDYIEQKQYSDVSLVKKYKQFICE